LRSPHERENHPHRVQTVERQSRTKPTGFASTRTPRWLFVTVPRGSHRDDVALYFHWRRFVGPICRLIATFHEQRLVCDLHLGAGVVLQHGLDRMPSGGEGESTCIARGALVSQLHKPTPDVPVLVEDRFGDLGLGVVVAVSHTNQSEGRAG
jgi:hypothetical protein